MAFFGGSVVATGGGSRPVYTSTALINESGNTLGTIVSGATNTYSSWVNIGTSAFAIDGFSVQVSCVSLRAVLVDISYGATGGANVVATALAFTLAANASASVFVPCRIPNGVTIWARVSGQTASTTISVGLTVEGPQTTFSYTSCEPVSPSNAVNSIGAVVNVDTVGTWVAVGSPTSKDYAGIMVYAGGNNDTSRTAADVIVRLGIGTAGAQVEFFECYVKSPISAVISPTVGPFYLSIPSGNQLWARADCVVNTGDTANISILGLVA